MVENNINNKESAQFNAMVKLKNAISFKNEGKYESALMSFDEALKLQENYVDAWIMKGVILGQWGRCSESLKCYDKIIEIEPRSVKAWHLKAATFSMMNRFDQAVDSEAKAIELDPDNVDLYLRLAVFYQKLKKFEDAQKCYEDLLKKKPENPQIHYLIGIAHGNKGDYQKALDSIDEVLRLTDFTEALIVKGVLLAKLGRADEAKLCANKVLEVKKESEKPKPIQPNLPNYFQKDFSTSQNIMK
jgi:tetratricopeptide (TPR) repeat protein